MFLGLGQYSEEDIALAPVGGDVWTGSVYDPGMTPAAWTSAWVATEQPTSLSSGGLLPVLQNVVSGAASVISKLFDVQAAKTAAAAAQKQTAAYIAAGIKPSVTGVQTAGFSLASLGGSWPILAIIGIGAFLVLKGKKGAAPEKKARRRRR